NIADLPAGDDVGDRTIAFHGADDHFGDQLSVAADEQFAVLQHALVFADVQDHKIPFRIDNNDLAFEVRPQFDDVILSDELVELVLQADDGAGQDGLFFIGHRN